MPSTELYIASIDECLAKMKEYSNQRTIVLFGGSTEESSGESWSTDCRNAESVIEKNLEACQEDAVFLYVEVGSEAVWNDPDNAFRKDSTIQLKALPTLMDISNGKRLEGTDCLNAEAVSKFFS